MTEVRASHRFLPSHHGGSGSGKIPAVSSGLIGRGVGSGLGMPRGRGTNFDGMTALPLSSEQPTIVRPTAARTRNDPARSKLIDSLLLKESLSWRDEGRRAGAHQDANRRLPKEGTGTCCHARPWQHENFSRRSGFGSERIVRAVAEHVR